MLLELTTTHSPASDLGYLLHKHPGKLQSFNLAVGRAHVFYPRVGDDVCTAALLLEVDPVGLVRGKGPGSGERTLDEYVNDRPYVASSMLAVAIAQVFGTALGGRCKTHEALAATAIPLEARLPTVPCRGGETLLRRLFEPLGYLVDIQRRTLDDRFSAWGESGVYGLQLRGTVRLSDLLSHLYVLIPVLDNDKHYWVGDDEVDKLIRHGEGWLAAHPERELIAARYLKHRRDLQQDALERLRLEDGEGRAALEADAPDDPREEVPERAMSLHEQRHAAVLSVLQARSCKAVIDLGCGEGRLMRDLLKHRTFEKVVGMDVSHRSLKIAADRLRLDRLSETKRGRIELLHGSLTYRDERLHGFDAAVLCEVIEHLDAPRLGALERVVFEHARPGAVIITTPNAEYNVMWESLPAGQMRHRDHRFEWTREQFRAWAAGVCARFSYSCEFRGVGEQGRTAEGVDVGTPTQMGVFTRAGA